MSEKQKKQELLHRQEQLTSEMKSIREWIAEIEAEEILPQIKKYEGNYYKFENLYSPDNKWWEYVHIIESNILNYPVHSTFAIDSDNKISIFMGIDYIILKNLIEITKEEFEREKEKIIGILKKM